MFFVVFCICGIDGVEKNADSRNWSRSKKLLGAKVLLNRLTRMRSGNTRPHAEPIYRIRGKARVFIIDTGPVSHNGKGMAETGCTQSEPRFLRIARDEFFVR